MLPFDARNGHESFEIFARVIRVLVIDEPRSTNARQGERLFTDLRPQLLQP